MEIIGSEVILHCCSSIPNLLAQAQANFIPGINLENYLQYTRIQRQIISHLLTLAVSTNVIPI
ncbi:hypothetical protein [Crocosphaera chwakensis]|uniref:Triosephosphate isomerase n=1 Tax=Crocosphaera chwakensis CCY0110 TaxID=391612 RepID=A3IPC7_9CHRO|nr:hypothetical protein [Crocosphaera chwakensis]EAZ91692.1 triosephosphate isomerase [Crocosphaera chwakensis CCY0110]